ncbi:MAG TPA: thioredoxin family protein [Planctomycetota bacterium]|nr:thioredoxin family protein [Planctomycetota bacterium]
MKIAVLTAALLALAAPAARAQEESLEEKKAEKLKSEFLKKADWLLDFDKAKDEVRKTGKPMLTLFSRSYAPCPACHALEHGALLTDDFAKFSKDYVLFLHVTTMIPGEKYGDLLEEKGGTGFPWIVFMDGSGEIIVTHGGPPAVEGFSRTGEKAREYMSLQTKAEKGDAAAKVDFILLQATYFRISIADAEKKLKESGPLTKEQQAAWESAQANVQIREDMRAVRTDEDEAVLGRKYYARYKEGKAILPTADFPLQYFSMRVLEASEAAKDADAYESVLKILKGKYGQLEQLSLFFAEREKDLKALRDQAKDKK